MLGRYLGRFNSYFADLIDKTYIENPVSLLGKAGRFIKARFYYLGFVGTSVIDITAAFLLTVRYMGGMVARADDEQDIRAKKLKEYATLTGKNMIAFLSVLVVAPGLLRPDSVTDRYLLPSDDGVRAGGNLYHAHEAKMEAPEDIEHLQDIIKKAARDNQKITVMGAGLSQGKQFLPEGTGIVIDLKHFNTIEINARKKTAIVGAGVRWGKLQKTANKFHLAVQVMQASNVFSAGGSIGTNVHGWKHTMGTLSNTMLSMDIINTQGDLITLTPEDDLFHAVTGGLGLVGIVVRVKLQLTDNELLLERGKEVAIDEYVEYFYNQVLSNDKIRMHLYRLSLDPECLLQQGIAVDYVLQENTKVRKAASLVAERENGKRFERIMTDFASETDYLRKKYWEDEVTRLLENTSAAQTTNAIMQPPVNAMFTSSKHKAKWLQEYFLPGDKLSDYITFLSDLLMKNKVVLLNASVRFIKKEVHKNRKISPMSYAQNEDMFAIVLCWHQSLEAENLRSAKKWIRESQHMAVEMRGTFYLPYQHVSSLEDFDRAYPRANELLELKKKVDPNNLFVSGFYQKYLSLRPQHESHIRAIMKSEATKNEFAGFLDTVLQRVDSKALYQLMDDILLYSDTDTEIYEELCKRLPEIMPGNVGTLRRVLNSLSTIKEDLAEQAALLLPDVKTINGLVEIGYPGRFVSGFKSHFNVKGKVTVVLEQLAMTDYLQTGMPVPYDQFIKLDYNKPCLTELADNSADVITCYVGLHHFPEKELEAFLNDVRRVLRPEGHFLLVDHDVDDEMSLHYAHGAHTFFNAVNGVSLQDEMNELRNFQPMSYWQALLEKHGLGCSISGADVPMIRENDPSRNRMVSFQKPGLVQVLKLEDYTWSLTDDAKSAHKREGVFATKSGSQAQKQLTPVNQDISEQGYYQGNKPR